ncbi:MAG: ferrochelatase [Candidatus Zixiibacteriota bacterium]|nr:MAG: ferrochelatase [candidate division Zixibacteria bacterium]
MKAILLVNMGGPSNLEDIRGYLSSIFNDPAILPLPGLLRKPLAGYISRKREPKVAERYRLIGGGSPLPGWTEKLSNLVALELNNPRNDIKVIHAFRYSSPMIENVISNLENNGIDEIILLPLFPHRTIAMTGSIEKETIRICERQNINLKCVPAWGNREEIISIWSEYIKREIEKISDDCFVLFVAHGIPLRDVKRGDDYPERVQETARSLGEKLPENVRRSLAFQSRVGPVKWTNPYLEDEIIRISKLSKNLVLAPLSFVSDCLETLYDLDIIASQLAKDAGFESVARVRVFNDDPRFAKALALIASEAA